MQKIGEALTTTELSRTQIPLIDVHSLGQRVV